MEINLTNINKLPIIAKHISSKFKLNQDADVQSRHTPPCNVTTCSIHRFIDENTSTVMDPAAKCSSLEADWETDEIHSPTNQDSKLFPLGTQISPKAAPHTTYHIPHTTYHIP